jgi:hypothetical protein
LLATPCNRDCANASRLPERELADGLPWIPTIFIRVLFAWHDAVMRDATVRARRRAVNEEERLSIVEKRIAIPSHRRFDADRYAD